MGKITSKPRAQLHSQRLGPAASIPDRGLIVVGDHMIALEWAGRENRVNIMDQTMT